MTQQEPWYGRPVLGIDLGTSNSVAAIWDEDEGRPAAIALAAHGRLMPSQVGWDADSGGWVVGRDAEALRRRRPDAVAASIKRYLGRRFDDRLVARGRDVLSYKLVRGDGVDELRDVVVELAPDVRLPAPEVSAKVLEVLHAQAAEALGRSRDELRYAVITVPAHFNHLQRSATRLAGELAGLEVIDIVNEPTAAALVLSADVLGAEPKRILVLDLGGGTFDIALISASVDEVGSDFDTRVVHGDTHLGGDDIDVAVARYLGDVLTDESADALRRRAKEAKVELSTRERVTVTDGLDLTREQLERCAEGVLDRALELIEEAVVEIAQYEWSEIDHIVLVGGQTLMPAFQQRVAELTGRTPPAPDRPQLAVALGAAAHGHHLSLGRERFQEASLTNVLPLPIGLRMKGGQFEIVVEANTPLPVQTDPIPVVPALADDTEISVEVYQGSRRARQVSECVLLASLPMSVPPTADGKPQFEIVIVVATDGTVTVNVKDLTLDRSKSMEITETAAGVAWAPRRPPEAHSGARTIPAPTSTRSLPAGTTALPSRRLVSSRSASRPPAPEPRSFSAHRAATPATCGVAMLVPLISAYPPPGAAEKMSTPGPASDAPVFEKPATPDGESAATRTNPSEAAGGDTSIV